jgi:hypothetical protein
VKREEKKNDDQHEDYNWEDHKYYKHKRCNTRTTKIKIMTTKRVVNSCNEERKEGR